jgi:quercetin dioxygenase-like cupin family protein
VVLEYHEWEVVMAGPYVKADGEGEHRWFLGGGVHIWKATAEQTGGAFLAFEDLLEGGKTTPLHRHPDADEIGYVIDGEVLVHAEGKEQRAGRGSVIVTPRGVPHAFLVTSKSAKLLFLQIPGSGDAFYRAASEPLEGSAKPVDFGRLRKAAQDTRSTEILGPPPFAKPAS